MLSFDNVTTVHPTPQGEIRSLDRLNLEVKPGEFVVLRGPSGCGKTTLLLTAGGMLRPTSGTVRLEGRDLYALGERERNRLRGQTLGFVFQMFHLLPYLDVEENIQLAAMPRNLLGTAPNPRALELLQLLGLETRRHHRPTALSAGERQRTAIARALLNRPRLVLADEPTGNLDPANASEVFRLLRGYHESGGTLLLVTHGTAADALADRVLEMHAGAISSRATRPATGSSPAVSPA
ncbi:MAG TPA: ABC transporter ATP-binding protein [Verrucomicrobiota bacterium]|nr:ABC transporter ATP-binding protein [Verrucomicrobiota bacterium]HNU49788.1 ABC transporter ATP-binding protein [Verrucomicrobiota bacterium]